MTVDGQYMRPALNSKNGCSDQYRFQFSTCQFKWAFRSVDTLQHRSADFFCRSIQIDYLSYFIQSVSIILQMIFSSFSFKAPPIRICRLQTCELYITKKKKMGKEFLEVKASDIFNLIKRVYFVKNQDDVFCRTWLGKIGLLLLQLLLHRCDMVVASGSGCCCRATFENIAS